MAVLPLYFCRLLLRRLAARRRQRLELLAVGFLHARAEAMLRERLLEHCAHARALVRIVELIAAEPAADPAHHHALRIALRAELEGEIARRRRASVEMLVQPHIGRHDQRAGLPLIAARLLAV